jgi:hypothetical protein
VTFEILGLLKSFYPCFQAYACPESNELPNLDCVITLGSEYVVAILSIKAHKCLWCTGSDILCAPPWLGFGSPTFPAQRRGMENCMGVVRGSSLLECAPARVEDSLFSDPAQIRWGRDNINNRNFQFLGIPVPPAYLACEL